jgi:hypothetical protein
MLVTKCCSCHEFNNAVGYQRVYDKQWIVQTDLHSLHCVIVQNGYQDPVLIALSTTHSVLYVTLQNSGVLCSAKLIILHFYSFIYFFSTLLQIFFFLFPPL